MPSPTTPSAAGYSGTPLVKKLGIKEGSGVVALTEPAEFRDLLGELDPSIRFETRLTGSPDVVMSFQTSESVLRKRLPKIADAIHPDRMVWVAWPKKTSGVETDLTGDVVRAAILETDLVDVKVCAISDIWSGHKAVWRKGRR